MFCAVHVFFCEYSDLDVISCNSKLLCNSFKHHQIHDGLLKDFTSLPLPNIENTRAVVSRDMSRSRDTIFQSLDLEGLSLGLGTSKSRKMGMSWPYFQFKRKNQGWQYGTFRICVLRTSHPQPYRTSVPYFSSIFEAYHTRTITKKTYRTSVPYFSAKIEAYRTVPTYRTAILAFDYSQL